MLVDVTFLAPKSAEQPATALEEMRYYLPQQIIQQGEGGAFVWIADVSDQVARLTPVDTGNSATGGLIEVTGEGLTAATRVIARGADGLEDGDRIRIVTEDSAPFGDSAATHPSEHDAMSRSPHKEN
jgi:hypothetical protein